MQCNLMFTAYSKRTVEAPKKNKWDHLWHRHPAKYKEF